MQQIVTLLVATLLCSAIAQQIGTNTAEVHPNLPSQYCTNATGCVTQETLVVLDSNWRWVHSTPGYTNCYTGNTWNTQLCPDPVTCASNCALDGANYEGTYGVSTSGDTLTLGFVTGSNVGSRNYLMATDKTYQIFKLKNREFTFDVDVSQLPCGLNGALYFVEMPEDGGSSQFPSNKAGAAYGTGYCDAQCPSDLKFIDGQANTIGWTPNPANPNAGNGFYGACCFEMDVWESNSISSAYTPHVCSTSGLHRCNGTECGNGNDRYNGVCDKDGCDFNSYRLGDQTYFGPGMTVDTTKPFTVVTQFYTDDGTDSGSLAEIRRMYVQNGKIIENSATNVPGMTTFDSVSDGFCSAQKTAFGDPNTFETKGGLTAMGEAMDRGMVLVMSLWDDYAVDMLWLDSDYPLDKSPSTPGVARGTCATSSGKPSYVESTYPNANVKYGNIKWGEIGSTFSA